MEIHPKDTKTIKTHGWCVWRTDKKNTKTHKTQAGSFEMKIRSKTQKHINNTCQN